MLKPYNLEISLKLYISKDFSAKHNLVGNARRPQAYEKPSAS